MLRAAGRYDALVADDPLDEDAQVDLVRDLLRQGRRHDAIEALDRMAQVFERELGVEPSEAARQLRAEAEAMPAGSSASTVRRTPPRRDGGLAPGAALPAARNRLIGRGRDLDEVADLLRAAPGRHDHRAGRGRQVHARPRPRETRAVRRRAQGRTSSSPSSRRSARADEVTRAVAEAVGVQGEGAVRTSALAATLGPRPVLLVLDNCEHLLDESAALVDAILDAGDEARVLVTSREPLRVDGEAVHPLGSLGSGAAELFVERAAAAAGADVAEADDPRVAALCERLDGLPLAIELAAAQLRHLSLDELVAGSTTDSPCWRAPGPGPAPDTRRSRRRSTGATGCSPTGPGTSSTGWASSPRRSTWTPWSPSAVDSTPPR